MIPALAKTIRQLSDPRIRRILLKSLLLAVVVFALLFLGVVYVIGESQLFETGWLESASDWLASLAALILAAILFPGVAVLILGFFLEDVARIVEAEHYPGLGPARAQPWGEILLIAVRFAAAIIVLNVPLLFLLLIPPLFPIAFYIVNGYLLGREYFELVVLRRIDAKAAVTLRRAFVGRITLCGALIAFLSSLPLINLLTPVAATMMMVHMAEDMRRKHESAHSHEQA